MGVSHSVSTCSCRHGCREETSDSRDRLFPCRYSTTRWVNPLQKLLLGMALICSHRKQVGADEGK